MLEFVEALSLFGFRSEAMMPVYGMAEATLAISFAPLLKPSVVMAFDSYLLDRKTRLARWKVLIRQPGYYQKLAWL